MKIFKARRVFVDLKEFVKRTALDGDTRKEVKSDTIIYEGAKPVALLISFKGDSSKMIDAIRKIKYSESTRTGGLKTKSAIFGYSPRVTLRKDFCSATSLAYQNPKEHQVVTDFGKELFKFYLKHQPVQAARHWELVRKKIKKSWVIPGTPFTSGIINNNNPLKYHFDSGNVNGVVSCMIVFKKKCSGGDLSLPEYNLKLSLRDGDVVLFDGQSILHGVTPIKLKKDGYRFSVVYYTLKQMWKCLEVTDEIARIQSVKTKREIKRK